MGIPIAPTPSTERWFRRSTAPLSAARCIATLARARSPGPRGSARARRLRNSPLLRRPRAGVPRPPASGRGRAGEGEAEGGVLVEAGAAAAQFDLEVGERAECAGER